MLAALSGAVSAQSGNSAWVAWTRAHSFPVASVVSTVGDDFSDLQFFKTVIGDRRLVQLGESGHGIAEFDSAKVRLIKFFHEQMGFDVIAFESSIYECFAANTLTVSAPQMLNASIFAVWSAQETAPLFDYLKESRQTEHPLTLAGFDNQISSSSGVATRPAFFKRIVSVIDPDYAEEVALFDVDVIGRLRTGGGAYAKAEEARLVAGYERLEGFLRDNWDAIVAAMPGDPAPLIAIRTARSMVAYVRELRAFYDRPNDGTPEGGSAIRDAAMADNLTFLMRDLYPDKKILVWAHNFHIRHANTATSSPVITMGGFIADRFRPELYTIGLFMNRGQGSFNDRTPYVINPAPTDSMEWVLAQAGPSALFVDMLHADREPGNEWMFGQILTREWGINAVFMVPRDQYDGILLVDLVTSPHYF